MSDLRCGNCKAQSGIEAGLPLIDSYCQHTYFSRNLEIASLRQALKSCVEALEEYGAHERDCILSYRSAGEPTENGGYREKYKDKWYQVKPIDETPKCECGFAEALSEAEKVMG